MKNLFFQIAVLLFLATGSAFAQINCVTDPPLAPALASVSVEPESGNTVFRWTPSTSTGIAAYILYSYSNGDGIALDTIRDPAATTYTLVSTASKYFSVSYVIAAMRLPRCTSIFSNVITSIFDEAIIDTCQRRINLKWNQYTSIPTKVTGYSILQSVNGGPYTEAGITTSDVTVFTLAGYTINAEYCFVIRANLENGLSSTSNKICLSTRMQRPPQWINADQATINSDGNIALSFTIDPLSEIKNFILERRTGESGAFEEIAHLSSSGGNVQYTDVQAKTNLINYYRLSAVNNCNLPIVTSNIASNLVVLFQTSGSNLQLSWNSYRQWLGMVSGYKIFIDTGQGFTEKANVASTDTTFTQDYKQIMFDVTGNKVCFYVSAAEISNPHEVSGESSSQVVCTTPSELITVPNVFTPDHDLKNDLFKPVLSFTPQDYHLVISDRQGNILFETRDYLEQWDGTNKGNQEPQGVYLWFLKLTTPSGKVITRTGTVTIINNR